MKYKLKGDDKERLNLTVTIMCSSDLSVLQNMKEMLEAFDVYTNLAIVKA